MVSQILILVLAFIAAVVSVRQWKENRFSLSNLWLWIVAYWLVLTAKNICDFFHW